jgi:hypothetical protein
MPSAACDGYWPEIYWNQPLTGEPHPNPYPDSPAPRTFQNVSPLDPQMFSRITDFAADLLAGHRTGKYSPIEVAQWLEDFAGRAEKDLRQAGKPRSADATRTGIDVEMQAGLGRFFAAKFRAGVLYSLHERTGDRRALEQALACYRQARSMWVRVTDRANGIYAADLSASDRFDERGQWRDRLAGIDEDIARVEQRLPSAKTIDDPKLAAAIEEALGHPRREPVRCDHRRPAGFHPSQAVAIEIGIPRQDTPVAATLHYRHVNQLERYQSVEMEASATGYKANIPASYTDSPYPLQYYFELKQGREKAWLYPGFNADLSNQPYFVLERA